MQSCVGAKLFFYATPSRARILLKAFHNKLQNEGKNPISLQHRFAKYLDDKINARSRSKYLTSAVDRIARSQNTGKIGDLSLSSVLNDLENLACNVTDQLETQSRLNTIDKQSCRLLHTISFDETLLLLNKLLQLYPYRLLGLEIYTKSIDRLRNMLPGGAVESGKIVNLVFLASLPKSGARNVKSVLKYLPDIRQLTLVEQCILSMATFKTGVKLSRGNIETIEDTVHNNLDTLINEPGFFVSLLKALRFNGPSQEFSLTPISERLLENKEKYLLSFAVPILALYAEMLKAERNVVNRLVEDSIADLKTRLKSHGLNYETSLSIRPKDVSRLLWATSRLDYRLTEDQLNAVERFVDLNLQKILNDTEFAAGVFLSLWILRSPKSHERVEYCFKEKIFDKLICTSKKNQAKLKLLLDCVSIEAPSITIPPELKKGIKDDKKPLKFIKELDSLCKFLKCLASHFALRDTRIECPVKSLRIYGVSMRHESLGLLHFDILNSVTCLKDTRSPNGLMSLKLRLVKGLGYRSILFHEAEDVEEMIEKIEQSINFSKKI